MKLLFIVLMFFWISGHTCPTLGNHNKVQKTLSNVVVLLIDVGAIIFCDDTRLDFGFQTFALQNHSFALTSKIL